jgi:hypothetical protein
MFDLDFKIKRLDNFHFSHKEIVEYYNTIVKDFPHQKWTLPSGMNTKTHKVANMYSWAIQSNLKDPTKPCPPYHIDAGEEICDDNNCKVPTAMIFGIADRIINTFPDVRQLGIAGHPPGTFIDSHLDNDEFLKIHIPIKTNPDAWFFFENERVNMEEGHAYLVNTVEPHGTDNQGDTDRVHLIFKFPISEVKTIINTEYRI